jgi:hypothetical protein
MYPASEWANTMQQKSSTFTCFIVTSLIYFSFSCFVSNLFWLAIKGPHYSLIFYNHFRCGDIWAAIVVYSGSTHWRMCCTIGDVVLHAAQTFDQEKMNCSLDSFYFCNRQIVLVVNSNVHLPCVQTHVNKYMFWVSVIISSRLVILHTWSSCEHAHWMYLLNASYVIYKLVEINSYVHLLVSEGYLIM